MVNTIIFIGDRERGMLKVPALREKRVRLLNFLWIWERVDWGANLDSVVAAQGRHGMFVYVWQLQILWGDGCVVWLQEV